MARRYYNLSTNSDLSNGGLFNYNLNHNPPPSTQTFVVSLASQASNFGYAYTPPLHPGTNITNFTSNYTANIDISVTNASIQANVQLHRINSTGTVQTSSAVTADQTMDPGPILSFSFTNLDLGTFAAGDRIRVDYGFRNTAHSTRESTIVFGDADSVLYAASFYPLTYQFG